MKSKLDAKSQISRNQRNNEDNETEQRFNEINKL